MNKHGQTFAQWLATVSEFLDAREIAQHYDLLTRFYHEGTDATLVALLCEVVETYE